jgi:all-trans-retinol 13,14-reductase
MNITDILESVKQKSESALKDIREQLSVPFFKSKDRADWNGEPKRIVVVGSGIGGMASAALFAKIGHHVRVLEMNRTHIGGHGRCLSLDGMKYSMGPQYLWEFGPGKMGARFLSFLGLSESVPVLPMAHDGFERMFIGHRGDSNHYFADFKVPLGLDNFRHALIDLFPDELVSITSLFDDMIGIFDAYKSFFRENAGIEGRFLLATKFILTGKLNMEMKLKLGRTISMSVRDFFDAHQVSPLIRRIVYGHGGIFAENESRISAIAFIVGTGNYHEGAWYPRHGFEHFFHSLAGVVTGGGGSVETGKTVVRLATQDDAVTDVVCEDGTSYPCDALFSDISPRLTHALLGHPRESFDYEPSHSIPTCMIAIKGGFGPVAEMKGRNYWWQDGNEVNYNEPDVTEPPRMLYIGSPTANGFGRTGEYGDDALVVFMPGNYHQEKEIYSNGPDSVEAFKRKLADDIIAILDRNVFPGIRMKPLSFRVETSVDIECDTGGEMGNAYGRRLTVEEILKGPIREDYHLHNLHNVSATKNSPGIAAGIFTAALLLEELTRIKL